MPGRRFELIRHRSPPTAGGRTLFFSTGGASRKRRAKFLRPENVPEFDGDSAFFVCERGKDGVWRAVRRVDRLGRPYEGAAED